jgi:hypothetical protein
MNLTFADNELLIPPWGVVISQLELTTPSNVKFVQYSLPVEATEEEEKSNTT